MSTAILRLLLTTSGYDTGQISGFLEMPVFLERFGERTGNLTEYPTGFYFTNVRSGLIVALVCLFCLICD
jgi:SP family sugar:H+ symporter-like MFS transporter